MQQTSILWQSPELDVTLLDIPTSIAVAQANDAYEVLLSTAPLDEPFILQNEPKKKHAEHKAWVEKHAVYKAAIQRALAMIRQEARPGPWCVPRQLVTRVPKSGNSSDLHIDDPEKELEARLRLWSNLDDSKGEDAFDFQKMMASIEAGTDLNATSAETIAQWYMSYSPSTEATKEPWTGSFHNGHHHPVKLSISESGVASPGYCFKIPPRSTLFLSDSTHSDAFRASFRELTEEYTLPRHFNLILLDPPWPSGSAKRKGAYEQVGGMPYMMKMLSKMDIDNYVEHNAMVGIWITNKESLRGHVLGPGGLFEKWNVGLVEEWIWVKTTLKGEPMFSLDSVLRKPYEVLLLGRAAPNSWTTMTAASNIKTRVIVAVPDLHSRKPCLKELLEPYMPDANEYSALEIFSRYLVAGWTSWGNEVIKFNWEKYWATESSEST
jgi:N6-adenosine-specific RNA methylase IME4